MNAPVRSRTDLFLAMFVRPLISHRPVLRRHAAPSSFVVVLRGDRRYCRPFEMSLSQEDPKHKCKVDCPLDVGSLASEELANDDAELLFVQGEGSETAQNAACTGRREYRNGVTILSRKNRQLTTQRKDCLKRT